jgi:glucose/arabinose dehydrogenase
MRRLPFPVFFVGLYFLLVTPGTWAQSEISLRPVASGLSSPLLLTHPGDGSGRLFILEQQGRIRILSDGQLLQQPFLDIQSRVESGGERGLLGLAFHPDFQQNRRFFVNYTRRVGDQLRTVIAEYRASQGNPDTADTQETVILEFDQPFNNHNGGHLVFGPDRYLYIGTGDGGSGGDPQGNAQNLGSLLGKILRIDVDSGSPYASPPDNPYAGQDGARPEIWAYGLRNPWRFSFDPLTGQIFAADVGQASWEEVDLIVRGGNYGWNIREGNHCYPPEVTSCRTAGLVAPIAEYGRDQGGSITGGYVYRGQSRASPLWGSYIFGDYLSGTVWALSREQAGHWTRREVLQSGLRISSFGEDENGELYLVGHGGTVEQIRFPSRLTLAQAADGPTAQGQLQTSVVLVNRSDQPVEAELRFYLPDGQAGVLNFEEHGDTPATVSVPALSSRVFKTTPGQELVNGWVEVAADGALAASLLYGLYNSEGAPIGEAGVDASVLGRRLITHVARDSTLGLDTAIAIVNGSEEQQVEVTVRVEDGERQLVGEDVFTLAPREQRSRFVGELVEGVPATFEGTLTVSAQGELAAVVLRTRDGLVLSSLPVAGDGGRR